MTHLQPLLKGRGRDLELTTGIGGTKSKKPATEGPFQVLSENQDLSSESEEDSDVSDDQNELETMNLATGENDYLLTGFKPRKLCKNTI